MTIVSISCIAAEAPPQEGNMLEKSSKFLKIVLDIVRLNYAHLRTAMIREIAS